MGNFRFIETKIPDLYIIEPNVFGDNRGYFMESYSKKDFEDINYNVADASMNANKRLMEDNYDDLEDMASMNANINKDAIYIKSKAIKDGLSSSKIYCKYCGNKIDSDSKYCNYCGKKLTK